MEGDILFQDLDSSELCEAIEIVTPGYNNYNFSHIGIVVKYNDTLKILEAIPPKVQITNLDEFLSRSNDTNNNPKTIVGRLKKEYLYIIPNAIKCCLNKLEMDYDDYFLMSNNKYYCSELIYECFAKDSIFELNKMTFIDPKTNETSIVWDNYFKELNVEVPEGELGINPGIMSISNKIDIIYEFGIPSKKY
tara:strand:- start:10025 stop:10600 length:576 start_codon:yes stop_codon:yes gene_type:complete